MRGFWLFVVVQCLFCSNLFATNLCTDIFSKKSTESIKLKARGFDPLIYMLDQQEIESKSRAVGEQLFVEIDRWLSLLGEGFKLGKLAIQFTLDSYRTSLFVAKGSKKALVIGLDLEGRPESVRNVIASHEFGHAIFHENFVFAFNGKKMTSAEFFAVVAKENARLEGNEEFIRLNSEIREISHALELAEKAGKPQIISDLKHLLEGKQQKALEFATGNSTLIYMHQVLLVYNELFADCFAILASLNKNPKLMSEAIDSEHDSHLQALVQQIVNRSNNNGEKVPAPREFALTQFKGWQHEIGNPYTLLDPVRGVLWELYIKNITQENIPLFLKTFLEATQSHVETRMVEQKDKDLRSSSQDFDPTELNQGFLRHFRNAARRNGLPISK